MAPLEDNYLYYPHSTDEEIEAQWLNYLTANS